MPLRSCMEDRERILEAARDYKYLLNRGYPSASSLDIVVARYQVTRRVRSLLLRCVHRDDYSVRILRSRVSRDWIAGSSLILDMLNVSTTLIALLEGECLYRCDDGIVRDLGGSRYWRGKRGRVTEAIDLILSHLRSPGPRRVYIVLDRLAPMSGSILRQALEAFRGAGLDAEGVLAERADREIIGIHRREGQGSSAVATSDSLILESAERVYDLAGEVAASLNPGLIDDSIYASLRPVWLS